MLALYSTDRLIRTEISTLIGLLIKGEVDHTLPGPAVVQQYLDKTEALLQEMHEAMASVAFTGVETKRPGESGITPFTAGLALREPIFYAGESAYVFQYRDLAPKKYAQDEDWLNANKGFTIGTARAVVHAVRCVQTDKLNAMVGTLRSLPPNEWTILPWLGFTDEEVAEHTGIHRGTVQRVLTAFTLPVGEYNSEFRALHDFNVANKFPLLRSDNAGFVLFHPYSLVEALYEAPFYWMCDDKSYASAAMRHRGTFAEEFSIERLERVFGDANVHANVRIFESKGKEVGEIDVLVICEFPAKLRGDIGAGIRIYRRMEERPLRLGCMARMESMLSPTP
jgi:hypothetical protein